MTQHEQIIETFNTYLVEAESFDTKGVKEQLLEHVRLLEN